MDESTLIGAVPAKAAPQRLRELAEGCFSATDDDSTTIGVNRPKSSRRGSALGLVHLQRHLIDEFGKPGPMVLVAGGLDPLVSQTRGIERTAWDTTVQSLSCNVGCQDGAPVPPACARLMMRGQDGALPYGSVGPSVRRVASSKMRYRRIS